MPPAGRASQGQPEGQPRQHHLTGTTIFGASSRSEMETLGIIVDAINTTQRQSQDHTHPLWVLVDAALDFQIIRPLARQPLHKANDSILGTQALHLWAALWSLPTHIILHLIRQESDRYNLGDGHIDLHAHNQLAEHMPDNDEPSLHDHMDTHLQHPAPILASRRVGARQDDIQWNRTSIPLPSASQNNGPHSANIRGTNTNNAITNRLQREPQTALYFSASTGSTTGTPAEAMSPALA